MSVRTIPAKETHKCKCIPKGDDHIYICDKCDYTHVINIKTGDSKITNTKVDIIHRGFYAER